MIHLKIATTEDIISILALLEELYLASAYSKSIGFDWNDTHDNVEKFLKADQKDTCFILLLDEAENTVGLIGMTHMAHLFNSKEKTAIELAFWLREGHQTKANAKKLLQAYRYWAKRIGCTTILLGSLKGNKEIETYKVKRLN